MTTLLKETASGTIEYTQVGQGRAVFFVHGGHVSCTETIFQKGLSPNEFCFITPSRPGYGRTPLTSSNKTPKGTAELFVALLDELKLSKVIVIGISAGGLTALEMAANYPDRVVSLVLMSALTKKWFLQTDTKYQGAKRVFSPKIEIFSWRLYRLFFRLFPTLLAKIMFREMSSFKPIEIKEDELQELKQMTFNMRSGYGFRNDLDQTIDHTILSGIKCSTLILHSNYDNAVDLSHPLNAQSNIKNSKLVFFNNHWGHLLWIGTDYESVLSELKQQI